MAPAVAPPNADLPAAALLCFCTYVDNPNNVSAHDPTLSNIQWLVGLFFPKYELVWSCEETPDYNYAFIARSPDNKYFLAIRGSLPFEVHGQVVIDWGTIYNWFSEDFNVFKQKQWPYGASGNPYIADGAMKAFGNLQAATSVLGSAVDAYTFLSQNAVAQDHAVYITRHSLGGNMADVYASYFAQMLATNNQSNASNYLFTFAAPAAGNSDFATDLQNKFQSGKIYHYEINNDIIPKFPVFSSMISIVAALFMPSPQATDIYFEFESVNVYLSELIETMATAILLSAQYPYAQTPITAASYPLSGEYTANTFADWFQEAAFQHSVLHYLFVLWGDGLETKIAQATPHMTKSRSAFAVPKFASAKLLKIGAEKQTN